MRSVVPLLCLLAWRTAHADGQAGPRAGADLRARIGSIAAPFYTEGMPEVHSEFQAYAITGEAYARAGSWRWGGRLPLATSSVEQPAGSYAADYTIGNPDLYGEWEVISSERQRGGRPRLGADPSIDGRLWLRGAIGLPLAGHGPRESLVRSRVLAASDALEGWRHPELYRAGVAPVTASAGADLVIGDWQLMGQLKLPLLVRTSSASLPDSADTRPVGFLPVVIARSTWRPVSRVAVGASAALAATLPAPVTPVRDVGRSGWLQASMGPCAQLLIGRALVLELDLLIAAGGPLRGSAGLGLHVGWHLPSP